MIPSDLIKDRYTAECEHDIFVKYTSNFERQDKVRKLTIETDLDILNLILAVWYRDFPNVRYLIDFKGIKCVDTLCLGLACTSGFGDMVEFLLKRIKFKTKYPDIMLTLAAASGNLTGLKALLKDKYFGRERVGI